MLRFYRCIGKFVGRLSPPTKRRGHPASEFKLNPHAVYAVRSFPAFFRRSGHSNRLSGVRPMPGRLSGGTTNRGHRVGDQLATVGRRTAGIWLIKYETVLACV